MTSRSSAGQRVKAMIAAVSASSRTRRKAVGSTTMRATAMTTVIIAPRPSARAMAVRRRNERSSGVRWTMFSAVMSERTPPVAPKTASTSAKAVASPSVGAGVSAAARSWSATTVTTAGGTTRSSGATWAAMSAGFEPRL